MRILWVKAGRMLPVETGGRSRSYNLLRRLAERNEVTLLTYYDGPRDLAYEAELDTHLPGAVTIHTGRGATSAVERGIDYLRHLAGAAPYAVARYYSPEVKRLVSGWIADHSYEIAICDFLAASLNFPESSGGATPTILFQHNVESALWQRRASHSPDPARRIVSRIEAAKMRRYEQAALARFDHVIAVSENDRALMEEMTDSRRISVVETGVDVAQFRAAAGGEAREPIVMFLGSMDWEANIDGVEYFCSQIWPRVREAVPEARFRIVGRKPHARVRRLECESVEVTGTVPSVIDYLREAAAVVVPLRIGGGTRLKIYEAMAAGKAIVSTSIGAEGLEVKDGRNILIADDAESFGRATTALLEDRALRRRLEAAAARDAARYDWARIARRFEQVLASVIEDVAPARGSFAHTLEMS